MNCSYMQCSNIYIKLKASKMKPCVTTVLSIHTYTWSKYVNIWGMLPRHAVSDHLRKDRGI